MDLVSMLAAFNGKMQENAQVLEYVSRPNIFDTIGKARNEMSHSKMIAHLLSAYHIVGYRESPIVHLLHPIIKRSIQQGKDFLQNIKPDLYSRIPETNFYYRHDTGDRINKINDCLSEKIVEIDFSPSDKTLLKKFYDNHLGLILSVHKIKTDNE